MTLELGTLAYLKWAKDPSGVPPHTAAEGLRTLLAPSEALMAEARRLARVQAAKLLLDDPPLGEAKDILAASTWLASAIGLRTKPRLAAMVLAHCPTPRGSFDLLLRHAIVAPALTHLAADEFTGLLRRLSPWSSLLTWPEAGEEETLFLFVRFLITRADGHRALRAAFAAPLPLTQSAQSLAWRTQVLDRLRQDARGGRDFVLEVYECTSLHHRTSFARQLDVARTVLSSGGESKGQFEWALAFARFWGPLVAIRRADLDAVRSRTALDVHWVIEVGRLFSLAERLTGSV